jgi:hypothetical protein
MQSLTFMGKLHCRERPATMAGLPRQRGAGAVVPKLRGAQKQRSPGVEDPPGFQFDYRFPSLDDWSGLVFDFHLRPLNQRMDGEGGSAGDAKYSGGGADMAKPRSFEDSWASIPIELCVSGSGRPGVDAFLNPRPRRGVPPCALSPQPPVACAAGRLARL